jgi:hypothetical protein
MPGVIDGFPDGWINNEVEDSSTRTCVTASGYDSFWSSCLAGYAELPRGPVKIGPTLGLCRQGQSQWPTTTNFCCTTPARQCGGQDSVLKPLAPSTS